MSPNDETTPATGFKKLEAPQRRVDAGLVAAAIGAVALLLFIVQNSQQTRVKWLFFDGDAPLWVVILIAALLAAISVQLVLFVLRRRRARAHK